MILPLKINGVKQKNRQVDAYLCHSWLLQRQSEVGWRFQIVFDICKRATLKTKVTFESYSRQVTGIYWQI